MEAQLPYLVAFQMPVLIGLGVWMLNKVINRMDSDAHPRWVYAVVTACIVYLILFFTIPAFHLAINSIC